MVMPMTSTKNFRLSSGFGVSISMWPRWARSKIGSGFIDGSPCIFLTRFLHANRYPLRSKTLCQQRPRHIVEQLIDDVGPRNKPLLRGVTDNHFQRAAHFIRIEVRRVGNAIGGF